MRIKTIQLAGLAAVLASGVNVKTAAAADVTLTPTDPVSTSTVVGLTPGDELTLGSSTNLDLDAGETGVTVDSNNDVVQDGAITSTDDDNTTGVLINQNVTGNITNTGSITLGESYALTDEDGDGDLDADTDNDNIADDTQGTTHTGYAIGTNRNGIWLADGFTLNGDILNGIDLPDSTNDQTGSISIEGNNSFGIRIDGVLDGDLLSSTLVSVNGDNSAGIRIGDGDADMGVTGDVVIGNTSVLGENSIAVDVNNDVGGSISVKGDVTATGYHTTNTTRPNDVQDTDNSGVIDYYELDPDDKLQSGSAIDISANVGGGLLIRGAGVEDDLDDDRDGIDQNGSPAETDDNVTGAIRQSGSAPAISINSGAALGLLTYDFTINTVGLGLGDDFGFYNRGRITSVGIYNDVTATGFAVTGGSSVAGGVLNDGAIASGAFNANAYGLYFNGGSTPQIVNRNAITATTTSDSTTPVGYVSDDVAADDTAYAIYLGAGSNVGAITNTNVLSALAIDTDANTTNEANATTIFDGSNSLITLNNSGTIASEVRAADKIAGDGITPVAGGEAIAIDTRGNSNGLILNQTPGVINEDDGADLDTGTDSAFDVAHDPAIVGNIYLGTGADTINLLAGTITGDISFNGGADQFNIDGGATFTGRLTDSGGGLALDVQDGVLSLTGGATNISTATFGANSELRAVVGGVSPVLITATGSVTFDAGAFVTPIVPVSGLPASGANTFLTATGGLNLAPGDVAGDDTGVLRIASGDNVPFVYNVEVRQVLGDPNSLEAAYALKTASQLGLTANQAAAYAPIIAALQGNTPAGDAFISLDSSDEFFDAYADLMPNFSSAAAEVAATTIEQQTSATTNRLDTLRLHDVDDSSIWLQEIGYTLSRDPSEPNAQAFDGQGFGLAVGIDAPLDNGAIFGLSLSFLASEVEEEGRRDSNIAASFGQFNAYLGTGVGPINLDFIAGLGAGRMTSSREVTFGGFSETSEADWWAYEGHGAIRAGLPLKLANWFVVTPQAALTYVGLQEDGYTEDGGGVGIDYDVDDVFSQRLLGDFGLDFSTRMRLRSGGVVAPRVYVGYRSNLIDDPAERTFRFAGGGNSFTLEDETSGDGGALVGIGIDASGASSTLRLAYEGEFGDELDRHSLNVSVRFRF